MVEALQAVMVGARRDEIEGEILRSSRVDIERERLGRICRVAAERREQNGVMSRFELRDGVARRLIGVDPISVSTER